MCLFVIRKAHSEDTNQRGGQLAIWVHFLAFMQMTDKLYKIYCEDVNRKEIEAILYHHFTGFTILSATGCYKHQFEQALAIEISNAELSAIESACQMIAEKCSRGRLCTPCHHAILALYTVRRK